MVESFTYCINMNGRLYDPMLGRMLSPDIVVQQTDYTQSYNRYSYCFNNPLRFTDPSGWVCGGYCARVLKPNTHNCLNKKSR